MKKFLAVALLTSALCPVVFANSNAGSKLYVSSTSVANTDLTQGGYEALTWIEVKGIGNVGETGLKTNMLNYDTWDTSVSQKAKGVSDAGSPAIEVSRLPTDPGQIIMRAAGAVTNTNNYAFKIVRNDAAVGGVGTIIYNRGLVAGPTRPNGKNEDFDLEVYTLGLQQQEIVVAPTIGGVAPANTVSPALSGTFTSGQVITLSNGTFTGDATITYEYAWFAAGVLIAGATANTYTLTAAEVGKKIQARVIARNASGSAQGWTALSAAVT